MGSRRRLLQEGALTKPKSLGDLVPHHIADVHPIEFSLNVTGYCFVGGSSDFVEVLSEPWPGPTDTTIPSYPGRGGSILIQGTLFGSLSAGRPSASLMSRLNSSKLNFLVVSMDYMASVCGAGLLR